MSSFRIRDARLPEDESTIHAFIMELQKFEKSVEADRRLDPGVAGKYFAALKADVVNKQGRIFIAENEPRSALGWACCYTGNHEIFVEERLRQFGLVGELFVVESARGQGVGRALIAACEAHFRALKLSSMMIGVLAKNDNARRVYELTGFNPYALEMRKML